MCLLMYVGPGHVGFESFDMNCCFGNEVEMTFNQMMQLRSLVEELPRPKIKEYVCRLIKSNVIPESKMVTLTVLIFFVVHMVVYRINITNC